MFINPVQYFFRLSKNMQYFFEVLYKQSEGIDHLEIAVRLFHLFQYFYILLLCVVSTCGF